MWRSQYRLLWIADEGTTRRELRLPLWAWGLVGMGCLLFMWLFFAYTPLRYTIPGYPTRSFRQRYTQLLERVH
ncbi:MAG: hypothetical protein NZ989_09620, partial [Bacteroidia bacterium]|nr:hypothetical protein [Bacteroidia bacterium]